MYTSKVSTSFSKILLTIVFSQDQVWSEGPEGHWIFSFFEVVGVQVLSSLHGWPVS